MKDGTKLGILFFILAMISLFTLSIATKPVPIPYVPTVQNSWMLASPSVVRIDVEMELADGWQPKWQGSGVIISTRGLILTNWHVVSFDGEIISRKYTITLFNGRKLAAHFLTSQLSIDLGLLQLDSPPGNLCAIRFGASPAQADKILVLGTPLGLTHSVSVGYVSGLGRKVTVSMSRWKNNLLICRTVPVMFENMIQTDALVCPGNSGGPMVDLHGRLVGLVNSGSLGGPSFAVHIDTIKDFLNRVLK